MVIFYEKNKIKILLVLTLAIVVTSACGYEKSKTKVKDMDYTVVAENEMPKEVKEIIEKEKTRSFRLHTATMNIHILLLGTVDNSTRAIP